MMVIFRMEGGDGNDTQDKEKEELRKVKS